MAVGQQRKGIRGRRLHLAVEWKPAFHCGQLDEPGRAVAKSRHGGGGDAGRQLPAGGAEPGERLGGKILPSRGRQVGPEQALGLRVHRGAQAVAERADADERRHPSTMDRE